MRRFAGLLGILVLALAMLPTAPARAETTEFRAFWVDAFGEGVYNEAQIDELVAAAKAANMNAIVAQFGRRGDCFCNNASMPRTEAGIAAYPFDPLQTLIDKAHAQGIEVHAWVIATAIWNRSTPPKDPTHVFNTHGPSKTGYDNWIMRRYDGVNRGGADYYLDPGHPAAADYIVKMYTSIVENYDVDGINFDRIRYPDYNLPAYPNASAWGYNPVAVARFQAATGRSDVPEPNDPQWMQWRRDQITNIVRRVYLESYKLKPHVAISADTITYGYGPESQGGWENSRTYAETLQDWRGWMEEGILDLNIPMNYKREHCTQSGPGCWGNQRLMYEQWNEFTLDHQYGRHAVIGSALYLNFIDGSVAQVRKALEPTAAGNRGVGWVGYSYRTPDYPALRGQSTREASRAELIKALTEPSAYDSESTPVFASPAAVPEMTWKTQPTTGHLMGSVATPDGQPFDQVRVELYDAETDAFIGSRLTTGSGWFGFVDLAPGRYKVVVDNARATGQRVVVAPVGAGELATVELTPFARGQEGQRQVSP